MSTANSNTIIINIHENEDDSTKELLVKTKSPNHLIQVRFGCNKEIIVENLDIINEDSDDNYDPFGGPLNARPSFDKIRRPNRDPDAD